MMTIFINFSSSNQSKVLENLADLVPNDRAAYSNFVLNSVLTQSAEDPRRDGRARFISVCFIPARAYH